MQPTFTQIKDAALKSLKGHWAEAIIATMLFVTITLFDTVMQYILMSIFKVDAVWSPFAPTDIPMYSVIASICITVFSAFFSVAVAFPLLFGVFRWFWQTTGGMDSGLSEMFYYFSKGILFRKALFISLNLFLRISLAALVCFLPTILWKVFTHPDFYALFDYTLPIELAGLYEITNVFKFLGLIAFFIFITRYALVFAVLEKSENLSVLKTIKEATLLTKHKKFRLIGFILSFFGWLILCVFALPVIFTLPYLFTALCLYAREEYRYFDRFKNINQSI